VGASLGAAYVVGGRRIAIDLGATPSPVPDQTGKTNYVDNARLMTNVSYEAPLDAFGIPVRLGFHLQGQWMVPRDVRKSPSAAHPVVDEFPDGAVSALTGEPITAAEGLQTNNPGYPGYSSQGFIVGAGLSLRVPDTK
jgi:hypothetical protein